MAKKLTKEVFVARARNVHGSHYDYSKVEYKGSDVKICITCPEHGDFWMTPNNHLRGHGCIVCSGRERITYDVFVRRSKEKHQNRYDYSKVDYKGLKNPVCIICPVHGDFWQKPQNHMNGNGCPICYGTPKSNREEFIKKARAKYGNLYDYSKVEYIGNKDKVCIICPEHGDFWMSPNNHLRGHRYPKCYGTPKKTLKEFVRQAQGVHGNKYDYSKVVYKSTNTKVCIICPEHGEFWQTPDSHLIGSGCPACSGRLRISEQVFIERARNIHNNKYDYSKIDYVDSQTKILIICPEHGEFWQRPAAHLNGYGCARCGGSLRLSKDEFIDKAKVIHKAKYDYSKVEYVNYSTKVCIICPEHGEFWQTPNNHLFGGGCPACPQSQLEGEMRQFLVNNGIQFEQEKGFRWLKFNRKMFLDFYLPEYKVAIECHGLQHFKSIDLFGGDEFFKLTQERDKEKKRLCDKHGIQILYFSNAHIDYPYPVFESYRLLLDAIKQGGKIENVRQWKQLEIPFNFEE